MSQERFCPECGAKIENDERFCQNCGTALPVEEEPQGGLQEGAKDEPMIGAGARVNATGGIHRTSHQNVNVNTSQVDNSQTVNNTTNHTIQNTSAAGKTHFVYEPHNHCDEQGGGAILRSLR